MARIYGIDKGSIKNTDSIDKLDEIDLFFKINSYITYVLKLRDNGYDFTEELYALEYLMYKTKKFGIDFDIPTENNYLLPSDSFIEWFKYYYNYLNSHCDGDIKKLKFARLNEENIDQYLPKKSWIENKNSTETITIKLIKGE